MEEIHILKLVLFCESVMHTDKKKTNIQNTYKNLTALPLDINLSINSYKLIANRATEL